MMNRMVTLLVMTLPITALAQTMPDMKSLTSSDTIDSVTEAAGGSFSDLLQGQLGLTEDQADGGIGSLLSLAGEKLSAGDFDKFAEMIPGASKYMDTARSLGAVAGPLQNIGGHYLEVCPDDYGLSGQARWGKHTESVTAGAWLTVHQIAGRDSGVAPTGFSSRGCVGADPDPRPAGCEKRVGPKRSSC